MAKKRPGRKTSHYDRQRLERAAELYLRECYRSRTAARVSEFATFIHVARPYLSRMVPELTGLSVREFLRRQQLQLACRLLRESSVLTVAQIALMCGFGTPRTFHRVFRAAFSITPLEYRTGYQMSLDEP